MERRYDAARVEEELKKIRSDNTLPFAYRKWASDGIDYIANTDRVSVELIAMMIKRYADKEETPLKIRDFLHDLLEEKIRYGSGDAALVLGRLYKDGYLGEKREDEITELFITAVEMGSTDAEEDLGICYYQGYGVSADMKKAFHLFCKAALRDELLSLLFLGDMYKEGRYVRKDEDQAYFLYRKVFEILSKREEEDREYEAETFLRLSVCHLYGIGTVPDGHDALFTSQHAESALRKRISKGERGLENLLKEALDSQEKARKLIEEKDLSGLFFE